MKRLPYVSRRNFLRMSALAATGAVAAACGVPPAPAPSTSQQQGEQQPAQQPSTETKQVVLWGVGVDLDKRLQKNAQDNDAIWQKWLIETFESRNPGVKVKGEDHGWDEPLRTGLLTAIAGGTAPDATIGEAFVHEFAALGAFNEVTDVNPDDFVPGSVRG
ncbi:MAG: extracellular solute-binding protein, partial [Chloroflexi bacterium]|nr:extracellular solute-binding protein [Chloroflexota bacterium]